MAAPSLHTATIADWQRIPVAQQNSWQRLAERSHGWLTPGNAITIVGAALTLSGFWQLLDLRYGLAVLFIILGRFADILDGIAADKTGTKSPLGESFDAAADKTVLGIGLIVMLTLGIIPIVVGIFMALHGIYNVVAITLSKLRAIKVHPSRSGKVGAVFEWFAIGGFAAAYAVSASFPHVLLLMFAWLSSINFAILALASSYSYTKQVRGKQQQR